MRLVVAGGRLLDPAGGLDGELDVAFADGRVAAVGRGLDGDQRRHVSGLLVVPGLIDLHTHVYTGGTWLGVDAATVARRSGTATFVDAGSAGAANVDGLVEHVIRPAPVRIVAFVNVSFAGLAAFGTEVPECEDRRLLDADAAVAAVRRHPGHIVGVKVRIGRYASGRAAIAPLDVAIEVAEQVGLPVMCHLDEPPPSTDEALARLRPGDVLTHCFRSSHGTDVTAALSARARGIRFDVGHGGASFGFATARTMLDAGFPPDTISSDVHRFCLDGPARDVLETMSKFRTLGLSLEDVIAAATAAPATVLGRRDVGTLAVGAAGDATVLEEVAGRHEYVDADGVRLIGDRRLVLRGRVVAGRWHPAGPESACATT